MMKINIKQLLGKIGLILVAFFLAYFIDNYYIKGEGIEFILKIL